MYWPHDVDTKGYCDRTKAIQRRVLLSYVMSLQIGKLRPFLSLVCIHLYVYWMPMRQDWTYSELKMRFYYWDIVKGLFCVSDYFGKRSVPYHLYNLDIFTNQWQNQLEMQSVRSNNSIKISVSLFKHFTDVTCTDIVYWRSIILHVVQSSGVCWLRHFVSRIFVNT
jgi:hypothetical protein